MKLEYYCDSFSTVIWYKRWMLGVSEEDEMNDPYAKATTIDTVLSWLREKLSIDYESFVLLDYNESPKDEEKVVMLISLNDSSEENDISEYIESFKWGDDGMGNPLPVFSKN